MYKKWVDFGKFIFICIHLWWMSTLDKLFHDTTGSIAPERVVGYQHANKEVVILCNNQRSISKSHGVQIEKTWRENSGDKESYQGVEQEKGSYHSTMQKGSPKRTSA